MSQRRSLVTTAAVAVLGAGVLVSDPIAASAAGGGGHGDRPSPPTVVVSGLNNPRQLSLVGGAAELLIAEAGNGGSTEITSPEGSTFVGPSGSISSVMRPAHAAGLLPNRVVTGLLSGAGEDGSFAVGSDGVSGRVVGGKIYIQETYAPPDVLPGPLGSVQDGKLLIARHNGPVRPLADISQYEADHDPDGQGFDSDPYAVLAVPGGEFVADAAANDVLFVNRENRIRVFHVFPNVTTGDCASQSDPPGFPGCNYVPTSLAVDRAGHLFVGGLSSETPGAAEVTELSADGSHVLQVWSGFSDVSGVAVADDGTLFVSQLFTGVVTRVKKDGTRTDVPVPFPAGLAVSTPAGADTSSTYLRKTLYVSAYSVAPAGGMGAPNSSGQVWRLQF